VSDATLASAIARVVEELPGTSVERLRGFLASGPSRPDAELQAPALIAHPGYRWRVQELVEAWTKTEHEAQAVALALEGALATDARVRAVTATVEPVWTGPELPTLALRRTEQALLEVVGASKRTLLLVSYAVYRHAAIRAAIVEAAERGVDVAIIVETEDESDGEFKGDPVRGLGAEVVARSTVLVWPAENRPKDDQGRAGVLHAKCAVADGELLLLSSANLTGRALTRNIEFGLLVRGGPIPTRVAAAFAALRKNGSLVPLS
jgi:phosphatidylserine/phosphatidylglycerophosphate/cardiolipin synthase-like enzyme